MQNFSRSTISYHKKRYIGLSNRIRSNSESFSKSKVRSIPLKYIVVGKP